VKQLSEVLKFLKQESVLAARSWHGIEYTPCLWSDDAVRDEAVCPLELTHSDLAGEFILILSPDSQLRCLARIGQAVASI